MYMKTLLVTFLMASVVFSDELSVKQINALEEMRSIKRVLDQKQLIQCIIKKDRNPAITTNCFEQIHIEESFQSILRVISTIVLDVSVKREDCKPLRGVPRRGKCLRLVSLEFRKKFNLQLHTKSEYVFFHRIVNEFVSYFFLKHKKTETHLNVDMDKAISIKAAPEENQKINLDDDSELNPPLIKSAVEDNNTKNSPPPVFTGPNAFAQLMKSLKNDDQSQPPASGNESFEDNKPIADDFTDENQEPKRQPFDLNVLNLNNDSPNLPENKDEIDSDDDLVDKEPFIPINRPKSINFAKPYPASIDDELVDTPTKNDSRPYDPFQDEALRAEFLEYIANKRLNKPQIVNKDEDDFTNLKPTNKIFVPEQKADEQGEFDVSTLGDRPDLFLEGLPKSASKPNVLSEPVFEPKSTSGKEELLKKLNDLLKGLS